MICVRFVLQIYDILEPEKRIAEHCWSVGPGRVCISGAHMHPQHTQATQAGGVPRGRYGVYDVRPGPDAHVRRHIVVHQLLHTVRGNDRHLLSAVLLRAEARTEHPGGD